MLFHYHFWTPYVEETEKFYKENGFRVSLRTGKYKGEFQTFNPPLTWDDFRDKNILFRIIEVRKGAINITFGFGKKIKFDHIGFLVSENEIEQICANASIMDWEISRGERRTFITTPYNFRIELQTNKDVIDSISDDVKIESLRLETIKDGLDQDLFKLFGKHVNTIITNLGDEVTINEAAIKGLVPENIVDPNGVKIC